MILFIDTEFNDYKGELISIALVDNLGNHWYRSLGCENPSAWVAENVIPHIGIVPTDLMQAKFELETWLSNYERICVIADWPEDIAHFCNFLITAPGQRINTPPLEMIVRRDLDCSLSKIPHNALEDAKALREAYLNWRKP